MRRALYSLLAVLAVLIVAGGALWYFAYGVSTAPPAEARVQGLARPVDIAWNDAGVATIRADSLRDRYAALGYVHGAERPWLVALWRQTATGRLGEWFGERTLRLDRHERRLPERGGPTPERVCAAGANARRLGTLARAGHRTPLRLPRQRAAPARQPRGCRAAVRAPLPARRQLAAPLAAPARLRPERRLGRSRSRGYASLLPPRLRRVGRAAASGRALAAGGGKQRRRPFAARHALSGGRARRTPRLGAAAFRSSARRGARALRLHRRPGL
ncbi:MAG: hypothetical protein BRD52_06785 [Bacteroidetes bacterium SW_4_67_19]|nr:MAG: hypothetical protein BRD52_06785 [Bacteroidetes bacterium SW_4_67_19]